MFRRSRPAWLWPARRTGAIGRLGRRPMSDPRRPSPPNRASTWCSPNSGGWMIPGSRAPRIPPGRDTWSPVESRHAEFPRPLEDGRGGCAGTWDPCWWSPRGRSAACRERAGSNWPTWSGACGSTWQGPHNRRFRRGREVGRRVPGGRCGGSAAVQGRPDQRGPAVGMRTLSPSGDEQGWGSGKAPDPSRAGPHARRLVDEPGRPDEGRPVCLPAWTARRPEMFARFRKIFRKVGKRYTRGAKMYSDRDFQDIRARGFVTKAALIALRGGTPSKSLRTSSAVFRRSSTNPSML